MRANDHPPSILSQSKARLLWFPLLCALFLILAACGSSEKSDTTGSPLTGPPDTITLYRANCVSCHGSELQGRMGDMSNLSKVGSRLSEADITKQIRSGGGSMPAFAEKLTDEQIQKLAEWLAEHK